MSFEETVEGIIRRVVREELQAAGVARPGEPEPDLVALGEVRRWVQVSKSWLKERIKAGELAKYGRGRMVRVKLVEVRALLQRRSAPPAPAEPRERAAQILSTLNRRRAG